VPQEELLGKSKEQVLNFISRSHYEFKDTLYSKNTDIFSEKLDIKNIKRWDTEADDHLFFDSTGHVAIFQYLFMNFDGKRVGMSYEKRVEALDELTKKFGTPEIIGDKYIPTYHWEDALNIYEFTGASKDHSYFPCVFAAETKKIRPVRLGLPISKVFKLPMNMQKFLDTSKSTILDSTKNKLANFPFVK